MNKHLSTLITGVILVTILPFLFQGCSEDTPDFSGDNRILTFALSVGGTEYPAYTEGENKLVIEIPVGVDLTDAEVRYLLSEQATIFPAPEKIRDWNEEQVFKVTSATGVGRSYILRIKRQHPTSEYDIHLTTDAEVRAFGATHTERIRGSLIIGSTTGKDSISDISSLTSLTTVEQSIIINPTFKGRDLAGLRNVREAGGLSIRTTRGLKVAELRSLEQIRGGIELMGESLEEVRLPLLKQVDGTISISSNSFRSLLIENLTELGSLTVQQSPTISTVNLPALKKIAGGLTISDAGKLVYLKVRRLEQVEGAISLSSADLLQNVSFPALSSCGSLSLSLGKITDLDLPALEEAGRVELDRVPSLVRLSVPKLTRVTGDFTIKQAGIRSLSDIPLTEVGGKLTISGVSFLSHLGVSLEALTHVQSIDIDTYQGAESFDLSKSGVKNLTLKDVPYLQSITLPEQMDEVSLTGFGYVSTVEDGGADAFPEIKGLKQVHRFLFNNYWTKKSTEELTFPSIETVTGTITMSVAMVKQVSFPALKTVHSENDKKPASISVNYITNFYTEPERNPQTDIYTLSCPVLTQADNIYANCASIGDLKMPQLTKLGTLDLRCVYYSVHNDAMVDLSGLSALEEVNAVSISKYRAFRDFSFAAKAVANGSLTSFNVSQCAYNPSLDDLREGHFTQE